MTTRRQALGLTLAALAPMPARAQGTQQPWRPDRPIRLVVSFAPGGSNDIVGRIIAENVSALLGQPIAVENRAGAGGAIGAEFVARAAPDGYTLLINSAQPSIPAIVAQVPYRTVEDFAGIAVAGFSPYVLLVNPKVPANTAQELLALLRANPGKYNIASTGKGSGVHLGAEMLRTKYQIEAEVVHYRGGGPAVAALVAGEAEIGIPTMASSIGQVRAGALRPLAVTAAQRSAALPNVPSAPEAGVPRLIHEEFFPVLAPAATPAPVVAALGAAFQEAIRQSAPRLLEVAGVAPRAGFETPAQVMGLVRETVAQLTDLVKTAGIQPD